MSRSKRSPKPTLTPTQIDADARLLKGLADPTRLAMAAALLDRPSSAAEIAPLIGVTAKLAAWALCKLRDCGAAVSQGRKGYLVPYALTERAAAVVRLLVGG